MGLVVKNKKANFEYIFIKEYTAGIKLYGSEVKSIRNNDVNIKNSHCYFDNGELFIIGMNISKYKESGKHQNHDPDRPKKLLLNRSELNKLSKGVDIKGNTIVPKSVIITKNGLIKIEIALSKGKKIYEKKGKLKEKSIELTEKKEFKNNLKV